MTGSAGQGSCPATREIAVAVSLMRMALALLDRAGELLAAAHLQGVIDAVATGTEDP
jgi:hypothetical protein